MKETRTANEKFHRATNDWPAGKEYLVCKKQATHSYRSALPAWSAVINVRQFPSNVVFTDLFYSDMVKSQCPVNERVRGGAPVAMIGHP